MQILLAMLVSNLPLTSWAEVGDLAFDGGLLKKMLPGQDRQTQRLSMDVLPWLLHWRDRSDFLVGPLTKLVSWQSCRLRFKSLLS
jgi:hypothetical protein